MWLNPGGLTKHNNGIMEQILLEGIPMPKVNTVIGNSKHRSRVQTTPEQYKETAGLLGDRQAADMEDHQHSPTLYPTPTGETGTAEKSNTVLRKLSAAPTPLTSSHSHTVTFCRDYH